MTKYKLKVHARLLRKKKIKRAFIRIYKTFVVELVKNSHKLKIIIDKPGQPYENTKVLKKHKSMLGGIRKL